MSDEKRLRKPRRGNESRAHRFPPDDEWFLNGFFFPLFLSFLPGRSPRRRTGGRTAARDVRRGEITIMRARTHPALRGQPVASVGNKFKTVARGARRRGRRAPYADQCGQRWRRRPLPAPRPDNVTLRSRQSVLAEIQTCVVSLSPESMSFNVSSVFKRRVNVHRVWCSRRDYNVISVCRTRFYADWRITSFVIFRVRCKKKKKRHVLPDVLSSCSRYENSKRLNDMVGRYIKRNARRIIIRRFVGMEKIDEHTLITTTFLYCFANKNNNF